MIENSSNWNIIPEGLKSRAQWCIAGPDKSPYVVNQNGYMRAKVNQGPWMDFETARHYAELHGVKIGFVLTTGDPFTCIDMDVKDSESVDPKTGKPYLEDLWTTQSQLDFYSGIVLNGSSYTEFSSSGKGIHTWVEGDIGAGRRGTGIEVYSTDRFIICTAQPVSDVKYHRFNKVAIPIAQARDILPIVNRQALLETITKEMGSAKADIELVETEALLEDAEVWRRSSNAANGDKFKALCEGRWSDYGFPSQSEADLALMSMFTYYSKSNEQCRRMFRQTALGQRKKAVINNVYLNRTLRQIRARQAREEAVAVKVDLAAMELKDKLRKEAAKPEVSKADVKSLVGELQKAKMESMNGPKGEENLPQVEGLAWPPGTVGALAGFIYGSAPRPVKEVAITAALGLIAGICGKAYHIGQSGLNLYIILIARSAIGKESMHSGISLILRNLVSKTPIGQDFVDFADFASGPALIKACEANQSFVNVSGEWGRKLKRLAMEDGREGPMQQLRTVMTNLYQKSGPSSIVGGISYSNKDQNIASVNGIAYSMIGETTPGTFYETLTNSMMEDGFLSRFTIIEHTGDRPPANKEPVLSMNPQLTEYMASLVVNAKKLLELHQNVPVQFSDEAKLMMEEFDERCDNEINKAGEDESYRQMWNRAHLKALRTASLLAVADNFANPVIQKVHAEWALNLVQRDVQIMRTKLDGGDIGVDDASRTRKVLALMADYIKGNISKSYDLHPKMLEDGVVPRKYLQIRTGRLANFTKHRLGSTAALDQTLKSIVDSGYAMEIDKNKCHEAYGFQGRCFRVISLPPK